MKWPAILLLAACGSHAGDPPAQAHTDETPAPPPVVTLPPAPPMPAVPTGLPAPPDHAITPEQVALGELLFFDGRLAADGKTSCASCHDPAHDFAGGIDKAIDGKPNLRRTPTLANLAWQRDYGWDGRYGSLDDMLVAHVRGQMGGDLDTAAGKLASPIYQAHFARAKPVAALAAYVLTRYDGDAPWDRMQASATKASKDPVIAGYAVFAGKAQCAVCHPPPLYTDLAYHKVAHSLIADDGRGRVDPTKAGAFKTPSLRGAARRMAFFHGGTQKTLDDVVDWYLMGAAAVNPDEPTLGRIQLTPAERDDLLAFVRALTATAPVPARPKLP